MCGIAGLASFEGLPIERSEIEAQIHSLLHRGPDQGAIFLSERGRCGLGVRRLSIIDVAGGQQPLHNEDRTVHLVYNGETYNHANLRASLQKTKIPNLAVMTSGSPGETNPSVLLGSTLMRHLVTKLQASGVVDVVLLDAPPCLMLSDASALASSTQAEVILVVESEGTHRGAALKAKNQFEQNNVDIAGVVLNKARARDMESYYYSYYPSP